jgi:cystathionine gamma-synthase
MTMGSACFGVLMSKVVYAEHLGHALQLFTVSFSLNPLCRLTQASFSQPATSLGGVESLIEQRVVSAPDSDPRIGTLSPSEHCASRSLPYLLIVAVRLSVGLEDFEDLKADLIAGFHKVIAVRRRPLPSLYLQAPSTADCPSFRSRRDKSASSNLASVEALLSSQ